MAKIVRQIDQNTRLYVGDRNEIVVKQGVDWLILSKTGTSPTALIDALLSAMTEAGYDMPDLSRHGYERKETRA